MTASATATTDMRLPPISITQLKAFILGERSFLAPKYLLYTRTLAVNFWEYRKQKTKKGGDQSTH